MVGIPTIGLFFYNHGVGEPMGGGFFAYGDASRRNEVIVMRLFCVGFCKIGK